MPMDAEKIQIEIYKRMTPQRKLEVAEELYRSARRLKAAWLRKIHPDWTEQQIKKELRDIFLYARS